MRKVWTKERNVNFWIVGLQALLVVAICLATVFSAEAKSISVEEAIKQASLEVGIEEDLLYAIATVESGRDGSKIGSLGEKSAFQIRPQYFSCRLHDPLEAARCAARYLAYVKGRCSSYGVAYYVCYNTGPFRKNKLAKPKEFVYYRKVEAVRREFKQRQLLAKDNN